MKRIAVKMALAAIAACASVAPAAAEAAPRFDKAFSVWPEGQEYAQNLFYGFRSEFDAVEGSKPVLRITGCSGYR